VGLRAVLDAVVKRKIPSLRRESNPRTSIIQPVAQRYTYWTITGMDARRLFSARTRIFLSANISRWTLRPTQQFQPMRTGCLPLTSI
jgi:hypothetical protein